MPRSDYWIKVFDSLPEHRKVIRLQKAMEWSRFETVGFLVMLWLQVASDAPDGVVLGRFANNGVLQDQDVVRSQVALDAPDGVVLRQVSADGILEAIGLKKKTRGGSDQYPRVIQALLDCGLLDERDGVFTIHDWENGGGQLQRTREEDNARQRKRRTEAKEDASSTEHDDSARDSQCFGVKDGEQICHADVTHESKSKSKKETPPYPPQAGGDFKFFEKMVLDTWTAECAASGRKAARDSKTALGAGKVARALMAGELAAGDLAPSMRGFLALVASDPAKATWDLNTYAKKPTAYLPKAPPRAAVAAPAPPPSSVTHRWRCDTCGREFNLPSPAGAGRPEPTRCIRGLIPGVKCSGTMSVVEKGEDIAAS